MEYEFGKITGGISGDIVTIQGGVAIRLGSDWDCSHANVGGAVDSISWVV